MTMILVLLFLLSVPPVHHVVGQEGFLSIDCGLDDKRSGNPDPAVGGIVYVSDGPYVDGGENLKVSAEYESRWSRRYRTVRSFPSGERNCYSLPTEAGAKYLVRLQAPYGNHDGRNGSSSPMFDLHLGPNYWATAGAGDDLLEAVFVAWASWAPVCLVNIGKGTPFVTVLELRKLPGALYPSLTPTQAFHNYRRHSMSSSIFVTRFPDDRYDRAWSGATDPKWANTSTTQTIQQDPNFIEPLAVLQKAATPLDNGTILNFPWKMDRATYSFMVFLHFADFQNTQVREFDIYFNGNRLNGEKAYSPLYLAASCVSSSGWYRASDGNYNITLAATAASILPPILNALEIYTLVAMDGPATYQKDFDAIMAIKFEYGVKKNWMGDPCFPTKYAWIGIKCSNTSDNSTRITSVDLSNSSLHAIISNNFTLLSALENLDLSYNNITGPIPDSLLTLPSLRVLNLSGNHLNGDSLCKIYTGSLVFRYDSDGYVCGKTVNQPKNRATVIAISVVVPIMVVVVLLLAYYIWREKRSRNVYNDAQGSGKGHVYDLQNLDNRRFTYRELKKFTNNFKQFVGKGGFGSVYYGCLENGTEVAVKIRSESSSHGLTEFLAEVQCLSKVHHRNLVSLVGYCWEQDHLALVYEYMSQGNLCDHLRGRNCVSDILNWGTRVRILLEAAQGLEYLHKGCSLPIIHRDVKASNILLGQNLQAKIADFGLSKTYMSDTQSHISTTAAGTAGYIDIEYYQTGRLTESSDVYSFGVVLLEVVTGEPPIMAGQGFISQRVKNMIATGNINLVADARLEGDYDVSSMWKVVNTAILCTSDDAAQRPTMTAVVLQLKESLALEEARGDHRNDQGKLRE